MDIVDIVDIDLESPVPPFEQVKEQITAAIEAGSLEPADRLPTVRQLATDLGLAANTVARSYRELELAGLVETRGRHGTFVATSSSPTRTLRRPGGQELRPTHARAGYREARDPRHRSPRDRSSRSAEDAAWAQAEEMNEEMNER